MPRGSHRGADHEIVGLARKRMGLGNAVYYAPSIPPDKETGARDAHALHLPESEAILVLHDATVLGGAAEGFIVTPERLAWKNLFEHPRQIPWSHLDPATIVLVSSRLGVAGGAIEIAGADVPGVATFLVEMATRYGPAEGSPYRRRADAPPETPEGRSLAVERLASLSRRHLGEVEDVYYHPAIPPQKLHRATRVHPRLDPSEIVAVLYDDTIFGSAEEGFLLTPQRLCWKNFTSGAESAAWPDLEPESVSASGSFVHVMGGAIQLTARRDALAASVARLVAAIAVEARGGGPAT